TCWSFPSTTVLESFGPPDPGVRTMEDQSPKPIGPPPSAEPLPGVCTNQPYGGPFYADEPATADVPKKAAWDTSRKWENGSCLLVSFLNGHDDPWVQLIQKRVKELALVWSHYANLTFEFTSLPKAHVSVNFYPSAGLANYGTYNSFVGT